MDREGGTEGIALERVVDSSSLREDEGKGQLYGRRGDYLGAMMRSVGLLWGNNRVEREKRIKKKDVLRHVLSGEDNLIVPANTTNLS